MVPAMKLERLLEIPGTTVVLPGPDGAEISAAFTSDLLSDVMAHAAIGSSAMISSGAGSIAIASMTRCRIPPESWCG